MKPKHDAMYWIDRFQEDSPRLDEDKKYELTRSLLVHAIPLQPEEADLFLRTNPNSAEVNDALRYSGIERKVAHAYSARRDLFDGPIQIGKFLADFRAILNEFYKPGELDEIIYFSGGNHEQIGLAVMWLVGGNHPTYRRIRNAYLPEITSLVEVYTSPEGKPSGVRDITHTLFDGEQDAVSQIEKLLGIKEKK